MSELIRRESCSIWNHKPIEMVWDLIYDNNMPDSMEMYNFVCKVLEKAQSIVDAAPTVATDEYAAFKCPECKSIYVEYNDPDNSICPICGCRRKE